MPDQPHCAACAGLLYDSSDELARSVSCLLCGRTWFHVPPVLPHGPPQAPKQGRPFKERVHE